jgi:hypothetical protein
MPTNRTNQPGVTIGRAFHNDFGANGGTRARTIFNNNRLTKTAREFLANRPRHQINPAASGKGNNEADGLGRKGLSMSHLERCNQAR